MSRPRQVPLSAITGHDVSGVIEEVGSDVSEFRVGAEVFELVGRKPENIRYLEAASLTLVGGTVWEPGVHPTWVLTAGDGPTRRPPEAL